MSEQHGVGGAQGSYKDPGLMEELYVEKGMSGHDIGDRLGCATSTVYDWLDRHGIERRELSDAISMSYGNHPNEVPLNLHGIGYERWNHTHKDGDKYGVFVHTVLAISEFGFQDALEYDIHHKNGIPWDNRPDNLELLTHDDHMGNHRKITGVDRLRVAELYENGDCSSYTVADIVDFDISPGTVIRIHRESFGGESP